MDMRRLDFAAAVNTLRPGLTLAARRMRRCSHDDAEDLVSEAIVIALDRLAELRPATELDGMRSWLLGILYFVARRDVRNSRRRVPTGPAADADCLPAGDESVEGADLTRVLQTLPTRQRKLVIDWLDGYTRTETARRNRLHRNMARIGLVEALSALRREYADEESLQYAYNLFAACSRVTIYRKPRGAWRPWAAQHPPERQIGNADRGEGSGYFERT